MDICIYLQIKPDKVKVVLEVVAGAFAPSGTKVNAGKSCIWCSTPVDTGSSGIVQTATIPTILKQALPTTSPDGGFLFSSEAADKVKATRVGMFERLAKLRSQASRYRRR